MLLINDVPIDCINHAAIQYHVPVVIILSVLKTEGGWNGLAKYNHNGSFDYGPFQINSSWLHHLIPYKIHEENLQYTPCTNVQTAAWILSLNLANTQKFQWGIGSYNSSTAYFNHQYFNKIRENYFEISRNIF